MSGYTPSTDAVRRVYSLAPLDLIRGGEPNAQSEYAATQFDRWLAAVKTEAAASAIESMAVRVRAEWSPGYSPWVGALDDEAARIRNGATS